jgi:hypothetical protein
MDAQSLLFLPRAARVGKVARNAAALRDGRGLSPAEGPLRLARTDVRAIHLPPFASRTGEEDFGRASAFHAGSGIDGDILRRKLLTESHGGGTTNPSAARD